MKSVRSSMGSHGSTLKSQMTPAAQYGLVVLVALIGTYYLRVLLADTQNLRLEAQNAVSDVQLLSDETNGTVWQQRADEAVQTLSQWNSVILTSQGSGVGAANLEVSLREVASKSKIEQLYVYVDPNVVESREFEFLRFDLSGRVQKEDAHLFIAYISTHKPRVIMSDFEYRSIDDNHANIRASGISPFLRSGG